MSINSGLYVNDVKQVPISVSPDQSGFEIRVTDKYIVSITEGIELEVNLCPKSYVKIDTDRYLTMFTENLSEELGDAIEGVEEGGKLTIGTITAFNSTLFDCTFLGYCFFVNANMQLCMIAHSSVAETEHPVEQIFLKHYLIEGSKLSGVSLPGRGEICNSHLKNVKVEFTDLDELCIIHGSRIEASTIQSEGDIEIDGTTLLESKIVTTKSKCVMNKQLITQTEFYVPSLELIDPWSYFALRTPNAIFYFVEISKGVFGIILGETNILLTADQLLEEEQSFELFRILKYNYEKTKLEGTDQNQALVDEEIISIYDHIIACVLSRVTLIDLIRSRNVQT